MNFNMNCTFDDLQKSLCRKCIHASGKCANLNVYPIKTECKSFEEKFTIEDLLKALVNEYDTGNIDVCKAILYAYRAGTIDGLMTIDI